MLFDEESEEVIKAFEGVSLAHARDGWKVVIGKDGGYCPCCERWGKIYRRALNKTMARSLMWLVFNAPVRADGWVHVPSTAPEHILRNSQLTALKMWDLVRTIPGADNGTKLASSGMWQATDMGVLFAEGLCTVQKWVHVYNDTVVEREGDQVYISDCLKEKYSAAEVSAPVDGSRPLSEIIEEQRSERA